MPKFTGEGEIHADYVDGYATITLETDGETTTIYLSPEDAYGFAQRITMAAMKAEGS